MCVCFYNGNIIITIFKNGISSQIQMEELKMVGEYAVPVTTSLLNLVTFKKPGLALNKNRSRTFVSSTQVSGIP